MTVTTMTLIVAAAEAAEKEEMVLMLRPYCTNVEFSASGVVYFLLSELGFGDHNNIHYDAALGYCFSRASVVWLPITMCSYKGMKLCAPPRLRSISSTYACLCRDKGTVNFFPLLYWQLVPAYI